MVKKVMQYEGMVVGGTSALFTFVQRKMYSRVEKSRSNIHIFLLG